MTNETPYTLGDYFDVVRRRWVYVATLLPAAILVAVYIAYTLPPLYRSAGTVLLEASTIPTDLVRTTVTTQIDVAQRSVLNVDSLSRLVEEIDPYPNEPLSTGAKARLVSQNTSIERVDPLTFQPLAMSNAFTVHYYNPDPNLAHAVADRLIDMFMEYGRDTRAQGAADTHRFILEQQQEVLEEISELETQLAAFRTEHRDAMPDAQARNQGSLDRLVRELDVVEQQIRGAEERRRLLQVQRDQINPYLFDPDGDWQAELADLRTQLAVARQRYTEEHPTVRQLRRNIQSLSARAESSGANRSAPPDNPMYMQVASQLEAVNEELAALQATRARAREQLQSYEESLRVAPEVERQLRRLTRDYDTAQERYAQLEGRLRETSLAQVLETEQRGERFTLLRAPNLPSAPDSPNRLGIILLGIVLGGAFGAGLAALRESADPSIRSPRDLAEITDIRPLAAVPVMLNRSERRKRHLAWAAASAVLVLALMFVGSTVAQAFG